MSNGSPGTAPPTRSPVTHGRALKEGTFLTAVATVVTWALGLLPVVMPEEVKLAIVGILVTAGTVGFSEWRNRKHAASVLESARSVSFLPRVLILALVAPAFVLVACVSFNGAGYKELAGGEIVRLRQAPDTAPLEQRTCDALSRGGLMLQDEEGSQKSLILPFFAGQHVEDLASRHERIAAICVEMVRREVERGVATGHRGQLRADWVRDWQNGRALLGGPEED